MKMKRVEEPSVLLSLFNQSQKLKPYYETETLELEFANNDPCTQCQKPVDYAHQCKQNCFHLFPDKETGQISRNRKKHCSTW